MSFQSVKNFAAIRNLFNIIFVDGTNITGRVRCNKFSCSYIDKGLAKGFMKVYFGKTSDPVFAKHLIYNIQNTPELMQAVDSIEIF